MELFYNDNVFDTGVNTRIASSSDMRIEEFAQRIIEHAPGERSLPEIIGIVSARFPFLSNLSVIENIVLPLEYHRNLKTREAAERVSQFVDHFGLSTVIARRKETIQSLDLLKAMFIRALSLDPDVVLFVNPHLIVSLADFEAILPRFRAFVGETKKFWIALSEGMSLAWTHEREVSLDV